MSTKLRARAFANSFAFFASAMSLVCAASACSVQRGEDDASQRGVTSASDLTGSQNEAAPPSGVTAERIYVGDENPLVVTHERPVVYGRFDLAAGAQVDVNVATDEPSGAVGFKLYRVVPNGSLALLGSYDGPTGHASTQLSAPAGGTFVVEAAAPKQPSFVRVELQCTGPDGACTPRRQPGETCDGIMYRPCDEGLHCQAPVGSCGGADIAGTCARVPGMCPKIYMPVCGCDGVTYGNACVAASNHVGVAHAGLCDAGK